MSQRDDELNALLRTVRVPERTPEYWAEFPEALARQLSGVAVPTAAVCQASRLAKPPTHAWAWGLGLATACLLLGFFVGFRRGHAVGFSTAEIAQSQKI